MDSQLPIVVTPFKENFNKFSLNMLGEIRSTIKIMKNNDYVTKRDFCWQVLMEDIYMYTRE